MKYAVRITIAIVLALFLMIVVPVFAFDTSSFRSMRYVETTSINTYLTIDTSTANNTLLYVGFPGADDPVAPAYTVDEAPVFITGNITISGNFTTGSVSTGGPPGAGLIDDVSVASGTPNIWLWGILAMTTIGVLGIGLSYARRKYGISGGYVIVAMVIGLMIFALLITFEKFDWWMLWFYLIISIGIAIASRHIDWGGATTSHSLIGFLAMSWIGLTVINRIIEGTFITTEETAFLNTVAFTQAFNVLNLFTIPILNFSFFTEGIPALLRWDYSFFGGQAQLVQYLLYSITAVVSFIIFGLVLGLVYNFFSRMRPF